MKIKLIYKIWNFFLYVFKLWSKNPLFPSLNPKNQFWEAKLNNPFCFQYKMEKKRKHNIIL